MYKVDVSEGLISNTTAGIMEEVKAWQNRSLDEVYPIVFFDCIVATCARHKRSVYHFFLNALNATYAETAYPKLIPANL